MLSQTASGAKIVEALERAGVEYVFGYQVELAMPIFDALHDSKIRLIDRSP